MKLKTILFDLDGTLVRTWPFIVAAFSHLGSKFGFTVDFHNPAMKSCSLYEAYTRLAPHLDFDVLIKEHVRFQDENLHLLELFPDSERVLKELKGVVNTGVVTNRVKNGRTLLQHCNIFEYLDLLVGAEDVQKPKPHPEGIFLAMEHFRSDPHETAIVGDTAADILAGKAAGVWTIGVDSNDCRKQLEAAKPDFLIPDLGQLLPLVFPKN